MTMQLPAHPSEWFGYPADRTDGRRLAPRREGARIFHHREREVRIGYIDASQHLAASPSAVWKVLTDPRTWDRWFAVHDSWVTPPPSDLAAGTTLSATLSMLGVTNTLDWVVESIEDGSRIELAATGAGGLSVRLMFRISPAGSGSWITASGQFSGALVSPALLDAVEAEGVAKLVESLAGLDMRAREVQAQETPARPQLRVVR